MLKVAFLRKAVNRNLVRFISTNVEGKINENYQLKPWHEIPGPSSLPVIGQLLHFLPGGSLYKRVIDLQEILYNNYGPIVRLDGLLGFPPITFIYDPEAVWNIIRKEEPLPIRPGFESMAYHREHYYKKNTDDPSGLILEHGEAWKKVRSVVNPVLMQPKMIKHYTKMMNEVADDMIIRMKLIRNDRYMLEGKFDEEMNLWGLESIAVIALGGRLNCFDSNLPQDSPVRKLIRVVHEVFKSTEKLDFQPSLWRYIATPQFKKAMKNYTDQIQLNEYFIGIAEKQFKTKGEILNEEKGVVEKLLEINRNIAVATACDMLFTGFDTTATTVIGLLYLLAKNPEKQNILREEIMSQPDNRTYIKACIKESLRIFHLGAGVFRQTTKEHVALGYKIPKDIYVIAANAFLCMRDEHFTRAKEFIPERWIVDRNDPLYHGNAHPFVYVPFGYGVRSCIGQRIAMLEIETFIAKIMENFKVEWFGPQPRRTRTSTINYFIGPFNFIFKDL